MTLLEVYIPGQMWLVTSVAKKVHIQGYWKLNGNGSVWGSSKKPIREIPQWVTNNPVVTGYLSTATTNCNKKKYKWCVSWNNGNGALGYHLKYGHKKWKENQGKNKSVKFDDYATNELIYCYYLMETSK